MIAHDAWNTGSASEIITLNRVVHLGALRVEIGQRSIKRSSWKGNWNRIKDTVVKGRWRKRNGRIHHDGRILHRSCRIDNVFEIVNGALAKLGNVVPCMIGSCIGGCRRLGKCRESGSLGEETKVRHKLIEDAAFATRDSSTESSITVTNTIFTRRKFTISLAKKGNVIQCRNLRDSGDLRNCRKSRDLRLGKDPEVRHEFIEDALAKRDIVHWRNWKTSWSGLSETTYNTGEFINDREKRGGLHYGHDGRESKGDGSELHGMSEVFGMRVRGRS
jgi:hypothetical protein